jgi:acetyltransferase-like isoleucine patch superfamily enzyme
MRQTYPFAEFGNGVSIHHTCEISKSASSRIRICDFVYLAPGVWLNVPEFAKGAPPAIVLEKGCKVGRRCMVSAKNRIYLETDVIIGPSVLITDHSHEFSNVELPIGFQGLTQGGTVRIERNCWIGHGAAIISTSTDIVIGRNSVVGANSVVTRSIPPYSVVAGNPGRVIKRYDPDRDIWTRGPT